MNPRQLTVCIQGLICCVLLVCVTGAAAPAVLRPAVLNEINLRVIPAYSRGNPLAILRSLSPLVARLDDQDVERIDQLFEEQDVPTVGDLLAEARLTLIHQNLTRNLPKPAPREILVTLPAIEQQIDEILAERSEHPALGDKLPTPETFDEYELIFWRIHVYANRLATATRLAQYGRSLFDWSLGANLRSLTDEQLTRMDIDFDVLLAEIKSTLRELEEAKIELRIQRVGLAAEVLQKSQDFRERFTAAYVADLDGELLANFLKKNANATFDRERLNEEGLVSAIENQVNTIRESNRDLVRTGRLLFTGLHWWLRGRYGMGPDGHGLLKSPQALISPQAQFPLYMPMETPRPTDPSSSGPAVPLIGRRHHYIWMYEYRQIASQLSSTTKAKSKTTTDYARGTVTKLKYFY